MKIPERFIVGPEEQAQREESEKLSAVWSEAYERLMSAVPETKLPMFTQEHPDLADVEAYYDEHKAELTPEEEFFLKVTIAMRKQGK